MAIIVADMVIQQQDNSVLDFLRPSDYYHSYYQSRVSELVAHPPATDDSPTVENHARFDQSTPLPVWQPTKGLMPPRADSYTVQPPEGMTEKELDLIKSTAEFVALNGKSFLSELACRKYHSNLFAFLKPDNKLFPVFTRMCDAYSKVIKSHERIQELEQENGDKARVLERCLNRLEWSWSGSQFSMSGSRNPPKPTSARRVTSRAQRHSINVPPLGMRLIIEKMASFVGSIIVQNIDSLKYNFMIPSDKYHTYYQLRISELAAKPPANDHSKPTKGAVPPKQDIVQPPKGMTKKQLDISSLTAQFVALDSKPLLSDLACRQFNSRLFAFLQSDNTLRMDTVGDDEPKVPPDKEQPRLPVEPAPKRHKRY